MLRPNMSLLVAAVFFVPLLSRGAGTQICALDKNVKSARQCSNSKNCEPKDRRLVIKFLDGREILLLGHVHGDPVKNAEILSTLKDFTGSTEEWSQKISDFKKMSALAGVDARVDYEYLKTLFGPDSKYQFLGAEAAKESYLELNNHYKNYFSAIREQARRRGVPTSELEEVFMIAARLPNYLDLVRPDWMKVVPVKAFESQQLSDKEIQALTNFASLVSHLRLVFSKNPSVWMNAMNEFGDLPVLRELDQMPDENALREKTASILANKDYGPHASLVVGLYYSMLRKEEASIARDVVVADRLAAEKSSGVLVVGHAHLLSLGRLLQAKCLEEVMSSAR